MERPELRGLEESLLHSLFAGYFGYAGNSCCLQYKGVSSVNLGTG